MTQFGEELQRNLAAMMRGVRLPPLHMAGRNGPVQGLLTDELRRAIRDDWERMHVVPLDQRCLDRAAELGRTQPLRTVDALHLAAADRLPKPVRRQQ